MAVRSGIATDATLAPGATTATTFTFRGIGTLQCEFLLTGGKLDVVADGEAVFAFTEPTGEWMPCSMAFEDDVAHEVAFVHTANGSGFAGLRNVRWVERDVGLLAKDGEIGIRVDLRKGVRMPKRFRDMLPFAYSSTNWIGDVAGVGAESVAKVAVVELEGTDPDVRNWPEAGTPRTLVTRSGEGSVEWQPRKGVWKATFDVLDGGASIHRETAVFDLRASRGGGFATLVK